MLSLIGRAIEFTSYHLLISAVDKISKLPRNSQPSDLERLYRENIALKAQLETVKREIKKYHWRTAGYSRRDQRPGHPASHREPAVGGL